MSGTDMRYALLLGHRAVPGGAQAQASGEPRYPPTPRNPIQATAFLVQMVLIAVSCIRFRGVRGAMRWLVLLVLSAYARATRCPVLTERMLRIWLRACYAVPGTAIAICPRCPLPSERYPLVLRVSYAMSGTDIAYGGLVLCVYYAMSGVCYENTMSSSDLDYAATRPESRQRPWRGWSVLGSGIALRASYAMSGTDLAYDAILSAYALPMRCPVLTEAMLLRCLLCDVRY
eukprot:121965-Rhodomonas_salina.2